MCSLILKFWNSLLRSEIDRLVALLHGRAVDNPVLVEEKTAGVLPSSSVLFHEQRDEVANIPLQDNMNGSHLISSKAINSSVGKHFFLCLVFVCAHLQNTMLM